MRKKTPIREMSDAQLSRRRLAQNAQVRAARAAPRGRLASKPLEEKVTQPQSISEANRKAIEASREFWGTPAARAALDGLTNVVGELADIKVILRKLIATSHRASTCDSEWIRNCLHLLVD